MTDPTYTRAIFVRDPKERITAAFQNGKVKRRCCIGRSDEKWCLQMLWHFGQFLDLIHLCDQPHWRPQGKRMEPKYFDTLNFVGHFGTMRQDARRLLKSIGAWVNFGKTGWNSACRNDSRIFLGVPSNGTTYDFPGMTKKCYGEVGVDYFYRSDYETKELNLTINLSEGCKSMEPAEELYPDAEQYRPDYNPHSNGANDRQHRTSKNLDSKTSILQRYRTNGTLYPKAKKIQRYRPNERLYYNATNIHQDRPIDRLNVRTTNIRQDRLKDRTYSRTTKTDHYRTNQRLYPKVSNIHSYDPSVPRPIVVDRRLPNIQNIKDYGSNVTRN